MQKGNQSHSSSLHLEIRNPVIRMEKYFNEYWKDFANAFIHPVTSNGLISKFVSNPAVAGLYMETWIRDLLKTMMPHYRISAGAIIRSSDRISEAGKIPECALIVWDPTELPAIFEKEGFALVPSFSVRALVEVKKNSQRIPKFKDHLAKLQDCMLDEYRNNVLGIVFSHSEPLYRRMDLDPNWPEKRRIENDIAVTRILTGRSRKIDFEGVLVLIYFVRYIAQLNKRQSDQKLNQMKSELIHDMQLIQKLLEP
ncbi:hypothetical protein JW948_09580 [bacterium]|nr:hypothetical protein [bacterium]